MGLALGMVQPTTAVGRAPRQAGTGIERSANGAGQRYRASGSAISYTEIAGLPLDLFDEPRAVFAGDDAPAAAILATATGREPARLAVRLPAHRLQRRSRSSIPALGRSPPLV